MLDASSSTNMDRWKQSKVLKDFRAGGRERRRTWALPSGAFQTHGACEALKQKTEMWQPGRQEGIESAGSVSGKVERLPEKKDVKEQEENVDG